MLTVKQRKRRAPRSSQRQRWRARELADEGGEPIPGTVVAHHGVAVEVRVEGSGERRPIKVRRRSGHVVGDRVEIVGERLRRLPRRNELPRRDAMGRTRVVAANLDVLGVVVAPVPPSPQGFIERALVSAAAAAVEPFVVLNKCDLSGAAELEVQLRRDWLEGPDALELPLIVVSAKAKLGLEGLLDFFAADGGRRGVFIGTSGVGKSSIVNALLPEIELSVGAINVSSGLGRHTTTTSTLHQLPRGGELIDTPGFRDFGLVDVSAAQLALHFPGFAQVLAEGRCRFNNCRHVAEPDCAIKAAVAEGRLSAARFERYRELVDELS